MEDKKIKKLASIFSPGEIKKAYECSAALFDQTMAQMLSEKKNTLSHRAKALLPMIEWIKKVVINQTPNSNKNFKT